MTTVAARRRRSTSAVLALALVVASTLATAPPAHAEACPEPYEAWFLDMPQDHTFCREVDEMAKAGMIGGYPTASGFEFRPTNRITRQAVAAMLARWSLGGDPVPPCSGSAAAVDVPPSHPFCGEIEWVIESGVMQGYPDGSFRPGNNITRQAVATIFARWADGTWPIEPCTSAPFADVPTDHPFCAEIAVMADNGIINGYAGNVFKPGDEISRQAFAAMLWRLWQALEAP